MTAAELKIGDSFKKQGFKFTVANIKSDIYKNGTPAIIVECFTNGGKIIDSFFPF
jgi:predicted sugar kinase